MKKMSIVLGATMLAVGAFTLFPKTTFAYKGDPKVQGPNYTQERHEAMTNAFVTKDYNSWKSLMGDRGVTRKITATNFAQFAEAHQLAVQGKTAEANKIRTGLGLNQHHGNGLGQGNGQGRINH